MFEIDILFWIFLIFLDVVNDVIWGCIDLNMYWIVEKLLFKLWDGLGYVYYIVGVRIIGDVRFGGDVD